MEGEIQLEELTKSFDGVVAVDGIDLHMPPGEFFSLLGPSGLRQDHDAADDRGLRAAHAGRSCSTAPVARVPPAQAQRQHGVPELRAVPAHRRSRRTSRSA